MKKASISETKNNLSRLLREVRNGATVIIYDRNTPVAKIEPIQEDEIDSKLINTLVRGGIASYSSKPIDVNEFLSRKKVKIPEDSSAVQNIIEERENGR